MFGYLRPFKDEMKIREYDLYKSVYCGLCRSMKKDYGLRSSLTLNYDCTVLAMLYMSLNNDSYCKEKGRCTVNPLKKCSICRSDSEAFAFAGAVSIIMTYYKLLDTIRDSGILKKAGAFFLRLFFRRSYKRARKSYPLIDQYTSEMMASQSEAEEGNAGIDKAADPTAGLISRICRMICPAGAFSAPAESFGYYVGRWIYLMDACDDLEKDIKKNSFNPFSSVYEGDIVKTMAYCNEVLNMTAAQIVMSYELFPVGQFREILDNIVYYGLSFQQKKYTEDRYADREAVK